LKPGALRRLFPGVAAPDQTWYRMTNRIHQTTIDEIGPSFRHGGRFNVRGEFGVLYLASSLPCAYLERLRQVQGRKDNLLPQVAASFRVDVRKCLDLTDAVNLKSLGIKRPDLLRDSDFSYPQSVAAQARSAGFEALIAPSAAGKECRNLVVFKDRFDPPSYCRIERDSLAPYRPG
jgi:RES domain-containing protein